MDALFYSGAPPPLNMFTKSLRPAMATQQSRRAPWSVAKCRAGGRRRQCHYCFLLPAYPSVLQKDKVSIVRTDGAARRGRGSNSTVPSHVHLQFEALHLYSQIQGRGKCWFGEYYATFRQLVALVAPPISNFPLRKGLVLFRARGYTL